MEIRYWKQLERHPLSAEYPDIKGRAWKLYVENIKENGVINDRKIVIHEDKVIDGWQLLRACIEAEIKPEFKELRLPREMTVERWVETVNDHRRHETQEAAIARADERRERVAKAFVDGQSTREIAEDEGVSQKTVVGDIKELSDATTENAKKSDTPHSPETPDKEKQAEKPEPIRCPRCTRAMRVGQEMVKNCPECKALRAGKSATAEKPETPAKKTKPGKPIFDDKTVLDLIGKLTRLLDDRMRVYGKCKEHSECQAALNDVLTRFKQWRAK